MGIIDWDGTLSLVEEKLMDRFREAKAAYSAGWKSVEGTKGRLQAAAARIDDAAKPDRQKMRLALLDLAEVEKANAAKFSVVVGVYIEALLACMARQRVLLKKQLAPIEEEIAGYEAQATEVSKAVSTLVRTGPRVGGAFSNHLQILIDDQNAKLAGIRAAARPAQRAMTGLQGKIGWLEEWARNYEAVVRTPLMALSADTARADLDQPATWPIAGKEQARLLREHLCPVG